MPLGRRIAILGLVAVAGAILGSWPARGADDAPAARSSFRSPAVASRGDEASPPGGAPAARSLFRSPAVASRGDEASPPWIEDLLSTVRPESGLGLALAFTLLGFLPGLLVTVTAYARILVVLTFVRQGLSLPTLPPDTVLTGLALFLTWFTMAPTFERIEAQAVLPLVEKRISLVEAGARARQPLFDFMLRQARQKDLELFLRLAQAPRPDTAGDLPAKVLVPAFILGEIKAAFQIGMLVLLPLVLVDLVVGVVISAMGLTGTPITNLVVVLKLALFTSVDGWGLIVDALVGSFR